MAAIREILSGAPDIAWGMCRDGEIVDGERMDDVFRIASMTKSFTAAAVMGLRDGTIPSRVPLNLDDPLASYIPEITDEPLVAVTVRDALTMGSGLPTDDAWADRQESMSDAEFNRVLTSQPVATFPAGSGYEYSNLSYAVLGRLIENLTGQPYVDVVREHICSPLGLQSTVFSADELGDATVVPGYRRDIDGNLVRQDPSSPGAFSPIGGLYSSVADLLNWVGRMLRATRQPDSRDPWDRGLRDMQQAQRFYEMRTNENGPVVELYGYGLHHSFSQRYGSVVYHSGGYPGYGSHMRWHPHTGIGIVMLGNLTYFPAEALCQRGLEMLIDEDGFVAPESPKKANRPPASAEPGVVARERAFEVESLIRRWDEGLADEIFADNMDLDVPRDERREAWRRAVEGTGESGSQAIHPQWLSATQARWSVDGPAGKRDVDLQLNPYHQVQKVDVTLMTR